MERHRAKPVDHSGAPGLVLDAGALHALERRDLTLIVALRLAHERLLPIRVPAGVVAQVWRGGPHDAPLARLLKQSINVVVVDAPTARRIGEFIAHLRLPQGTRPDIVDAHVALMARSTKSLVWTSDPVDMTLYGVPKSLIRAI